MHSQFMSVRPGNGDTLGTIGNEISFVKIWSNFVVRFPQFCLTDVTEFSHTLSLWICTCTKGT